MKTRRFASATLGLATLFFATLRPAHADLFDFAGTTVSGSLQLNGFSYTDGPLTIAENGDARLNFNLNFDQGPAPEFGIFFDDDGSGFFPFDYQATLSIANIPNTAFTLDSGFILTITGLFAAPGSPSAIGDFNFVEASGSALLFGALTSSYNAQTGTLVITSTEDIEIPGMTPLALSGRFLASPIPEPSSFALLAALPALAFALSRRVRRR